jgi:hypothetical protein
MSDRANAKAILRTYQQVSDEQQELTLAAEVHSLTEKYKALQQDYEHLVKQVKHLRR